MNEMPHDEKAGTPPPARPAPPDYLNSTAAHSDAAEIVRAIDAAQRTRNFASTHLRAVVAAYARNARAAGVPPERLLVAVKTLVRDVALAEMNDWFRGVLTDRAVAWTIEAYFDIDDR
ncbi:MAG TPA: hypothetical protein VFS44_00365 [Gemmatimonadaceae bacterium]|nr:hypothetical protein [Gemmatimonadaceae bacterium]